ncbi:iron ABC transporter permease [Secundilactobacillus folii]|uniref:Iron chelate uptake ABC transporter family permease subunit n=1 Tax=Secundilactobacillus folii TaxID=2678357 RepID=A0A7X2XV39_9LACO|nr:iron chelate uptake ABC transporter family permease subunit [Secundilactobacillus folii]
MSNAKQQHRIIWLALISLVLLALISLCFGNYQIPLTHLYDAILGSLTGQTLVSPIESNIIFSLRLPRMLAAICIGAALAISGTAYQSIFQNPLVSPDLLGVSNGAAVGAALAILFGWHALGTQIMAFLLGLAAVLLSVMIPRLMGRSTNLTLVLAGVVVSGLMQAILGLLKYLADPDSQLQNIVYWQLGSLSKVTVGNLVSVLPMMLLGMIVLWIMRWRLTVLGLGDAAAQSMGVNVKVERRIVVVCATILTAASVCLSGTIGWIGLVVPHMARMLIGPNTRYSLPLSALVGAIFLLIVDTLARTLSAGEIPLSILTGFIGTPIFIYILATRKVTLR